MIRKFNETKSEAQFEPLTSFRLKDQLNPKIWENFKLDPDVREDLIKIAEDYFESLELEGAELKDIMFTGSLANFNWSKYSDFDLHLIFDFSQINEDRELVKKYLDSNRAMWNLQHDIKIKGYDVEIYSQDVDEEHTSSGEYSLMKGEWIKKPTKQDFEPDEKLIRKKSESIMDSVKDMERDFKEGIEYDELNERLKKVWKKIKDGRKAGLEREGEFSIENLVFKLLRRNGYIERILKLKGDAYDKQFK